MDESTSSRLDACAARSARLHPGLRFLFEGRTPALLAPMAGVNDIVFRRLCLEQGCDLTYTEMISSKALSFANEKTRHLLDLAEGERRVAIQLFGHEPEVMAREAAWVEDELGDALALIDINMGCPAHKIVKKGDGSALMRDQDLAASIVRDVARAVSCPVTVKFRRGFGAEEETAVDFGLRMEDAGAAAVTVHGRTAAQMYRGPSEWECVARVKAALSVPVIGNGDIVSGASAADMVRATGCDGVMIARGAQGNPWIFADVRRVLDGMPPAPDPTRQDRVEMARRHIHLLSSRLGNTVVYMRKHVMWYLHGVPGASRARAALNACVTVDDFDRVLDELLADAARIEEEDRAYRGV